MLYDVEYLYMYEGSDIINGVYLKFDKVIAYICLNRKYKFIDIVIETKKEISKRIDLSCYLEGVINYLCNNELLINVKKELFNIKEDMLKYNIKYITLKSFNISDFDVKVIHNKLNNLKGFETFNCNFSECCSLGILECNIIDNYSNIYSLDIFNGFQGHLLCLKESKILNMNKNVLHLNNVITTFKEIDIDYKYFFLTTDAPLMRKLEILRNTRLIHDDLSFISGFYNLESINIDAFVNNYDEIIKLEKLRRVEGIYCLKTEELNNDRCIDKLLEYGISFNKIENYLITRRLELQNKYQELLHKLYVARLERVKWEDKITIADLEFIKKDLLEISQLSIIERKNISREPKKNFNIIDAQDGLWFDEHEQEEFILNDSRPFEGGGINYYTLKKKIYIEE